MHHYRRTNRDGHTRRALPLRVNLSVLAVGGAAEAVAEVVQHAGFGVELGVRGEGVVAMAGDLWSKRELLCCSLFILLKLSVPAPT